MEEALRLYMLGDMDLRALLGEGSDSAPFRWYPDAVPQGAAFPAVTYDVQGEDRGDAYTQSGDCDFCTTQMELTLIATTATARTTLWNVVRRRLKLFQKSCANGTVSGMAGVSVQYLTIGNSNNDFIPPQANERIGYYLKIVPLEIKHSED